MKSFVIVKDVNIDNRKKKIEAACSSHRKRCSRDRNSHSAEAGRWVGGRRPAKTTMKSCSILEEMITCQKCKP